MKNISILITLFLFLSFQTGLFAQEEHSESHSMKGSHRLSLGLGHAHISQGKIDGKNEWLVAPTWAIDYDYWIGDKWAIGLQNEIVVETFSIEDNADELVERSYPISVIPSVIWKPFKRLSFVGGLGLEFSEGDNLTVVRLGLEYGFHLPKNFEISAALVFDDKIDYYNSYGFAITVGKIFSKEKHHQNE